MEDPKAFALGAVDYVYTHRRADLRQALARKDPFIWPIWMKICEITKMDQRLDMAEAKVFLDDHIKNPDALPSSVKIVGNLFHDLNKEIGRQNLEKIDEQYEKNKAASRPLTIDAGHSVSLGSNSSIHTAGEGAKVVETHVDGEGMVMQGRQFFASVSYTNLALTGIFLALLFQRTSGADSGGSPSLIGRLLGW
jgi:hypothetical protein